MSSITIEQQFSPNYKKGRQGRKIMAIVNHITAGLMPGTLSWLLNPQAKASAHYLITKSGRVIQLAADEDTAFAVGNVNHPDWPLYDGSNPNYYTLSIEHEALAGEGLTELQFLASLELHQMLIKKWQIPVDRDHIIGHYRLDSVNRKNDPGANFPWERLFSELVKPDPLSAYEQVKIIIGENVLTGYLIDNRSYASVRAICEALGHKVRWEASTKTVIID